MADDDDGRLETVDELLEQVEPVGVEVVGGLVEQVDVEAREQQRGEADAGRLTAGERRHRRGRGRRRARGRGRPRRAARRSRRRRGPASPPGRRSSASAASGSPSASAVGWRSNSSWAAATPVRRARCSRTVSPGERLGLLREVADVRGRRRAACTDAGVGPPHRRRGCRSSVVLPAPLGPTRPMTSPGATTRSSPENSSRSPCPAATPRACTVALMAALSRAGDWGPTGTAPGSPAPAALEAGQGAVADLHGHRQAALAVRLRPRRRDGRLRRRGRARCSPSRSDGHRRRR